MKPEEIDGVARALYEKHSDGPFMDEDSFVSALTEAIAEIQKRQNPVGYFTHDREFGYEQSDPENAGCSDVFPRYRIPPAEAGCVVPENIRVIVDREGVRFGKNCWFSHEHMTHGVGDITQSAYQRWVEDSLAAAPEPPK